LYRFEFFRRSVKKLPILLKQNIYPVHIPILLEFVPISHRGKIDLDGFIPATILIVKGILLSR